MIYEISIWNVGSIRDEQILDLRIPANAPDSDGFATPASDPAVRLPKIVAFFGANGSGKTTALRALWSMIGFISSSFHSGVGAPLVEFHRFAGPPAARHDGWLRIRLELEGRWVDPVQSHRYSYELCIGEYRYPDTFGALRKEELAWYPHGRRQVIFSRDINHIKPGAALGMGARDPRLIAARRGASVISTLAQFGHELATRMVHDLAAISSNLDEAEPNMQQLAAYYRDHPDELPALRETIGRADLGLSDVELVLGEQGPELLFHHKGLSAPLGFQRQSEGTRKFLRRWPAIGRALQTGSLIILDDIDDDLHPLLLAEIVRWFHSPELNPRNAQLWLSSHSPVLMDELEKEEIFFTSKGQDGATEIYGARHIRGLRREPQLSRKYLGGVLGAVPHLG